MYSSHEITDTLVPNELQLGQKFLERFDTAEKPIVEKPLFVGYPYNGVPQRNRLFLSVNPHGRETVRIFFRSIDTVTSDFLLSSLVDDIYAKYRCIKEQSMHEVPLNKPNQKSHHGRDFEHAIHLVYNEYVSAKKHLELNRAKGKSRSFDSFIIYNNDAVSKEGIPLQQGRIGFLRDIYEYINNVGHYASNSTDVEIRHKYANYFLVTLAEQLKANLLREPLPGDAHIPPVVVTITEPIQQIFDLLHEERNAFYKRLSLLGKYKLVGFVGLFLYNHLKLGQSFQNNTIRIYDPNEPQGDPKDNKKVVRKSKRSQRYRLSTQLFQVGYFGNNISDQSQLLIGSMMIENYLYQYFGITEQFQSHDYFDKINKRLCEGTSVMDAFQSDS